MKFLIGAIGIAFMSLMAYSLLVSVGVLVNLVEDPAMPTPNGTPLPLSQWSDEQLSAAIAAKTKQVDFRKLPENLSQWSDDELEAGILVRRAVMEQRLNVARHQVKSEAQNSRAVTGIGTLPYLGRQFVAPIR